MAKKYETERPILGLEIVSLDPDACGYWLKRNMLDEMEDLDISTKDPASWLEFTLNRIFDDDDYADIDEAAIKLFCRSNVERLDIRAGGFLHSLRKDYVK